MQNDNELKQLVKILFPTRRDFEQNAKDYGLDDQTIHWAQKSLYDFRSEKSIPRRQVLGKIKKLQGDLGELIRSSPLPKQVKEKITRITEESPFSKNRRKKLRHFLEELYRWKWYLNSLDFDQLTAYDCIYWNFSVMIMKGLIPLPVVLLGRWASDHLPSRKKADAFKKDILEKIDNPDSLALVKASYFPADSGEEYLLKKGLSENHLKILKKIFDSIHYQNKSSTKYRYFMDYLISKGILEKGLNYSTRGRCNYYRVNL